MSHLFDDVARTLAAPMPRRKAMGLLGGTLTAAIWSALGAAPSAAKCEAPQFSCGNGAANSICCPPNTCCADHGNAAACCTRGQCVCTNGTCASSTGGACPKNCTVC